MRDGSFLTLLRDVVSIRRPQVTVTALGTPRAPRYVPVTEDVPCRLQPLAANRAGTVLGQTEHATHAGYLEPADVRAGDLLVERVVRFELAEDVEAGSKGFVVSDEAGLARGLKVELGAGEGSELHLVTDGIGGSVTVADAVSGDHPAGDPVYVVAVYEVCGVKDEAGQGHHLRLDLRVPGN